MVDDAVGRFQDGAGRAIVLLQADDLGLEVTAEVSHVFDPRAAPAVDRLVVVADDEQAVGIPGQQTHQGVLQGVGVLKFVDQDVAEAALIVSSAFRPVAQQLDRAQQQLGEIDQAGALAVVLVALVDLDLAGLEVAAKMLDLTWAAAVVLVVIDEALDLARRMLAFVEFHVADHPANQAVLVFGVENLEGVGQIDLGGVHAQQAMADAVKGPDPQSVRTQIQQSPDPATHFAGGLVGKRHRQQPHGRDVMDLDQPGDPVHQHPRLARPGPGQHQQMAVLGRDGLALRVVEVFKKVRDVHFSRDQGLGTRDQWSVAIGRKSCPDRNSIHRRILRNQRHCQLASLFYWSLVPDPWSLNRVPGPWSLTIARCPISRR